MVPISGIAQHYSLVRSVDAVSTDSYMPNVSYYMRGINMRKNKAVITIAIRLRYDYDKTTTKN